MKDVSTADPDPIHRFVLCSRLSVTLDICDKSNKRTFVSTTFYLVWCIASQVLNTEFIEETILVLRLVISLIVLLSQLIQDSYNIFIYLSSCKMDGNELFSVLVWIFVTTKHFEIFFSNKTYKTIPERSHLSSTVIKYIKIKLVINLLKFRIMKKDLISSISNVVQF